MYFVIVLDADPNMYWCGYEPNPVTPGAGCHIWKPGAEGRRHAVCFFDEPSAKKAGVGAPNTPYGRADLEPHRGVRVVQLGQPASGGGKP